MSKTLNLHKVEVFVPDGEGRICVKGKGVTSYVELARLINDADPEYRLTRHDGVAIHRADEASSNKYEPGFNIFHNFRDAIDVFTTDPGSLVAQSVADVIRVSEFERGGEIRHDVDGDFIDVGRFLDGEPEHFGLMAYGVEQAKFITINVSGGFPSYVSSGYIEKQSQHLQEMIYQLERNGYRCRVVVHHNNGCQDMAIEAKGFSDTLNEADIAVMLHPERLRRVDFAYIEHSPAWTYGYGSGNSTGEYVENLAHEGTEHEYTLNVAFKKYGDDFKERLDALAKKLITNDPSVPRGGLLELN